MQQRPDAVYPLAALAGQARMKRALLLLAVDPGLGGVLLLGEKGTAKSTAVRGLAELLPLIDAAGGDGRRETAPHSVPTPFFTLPLGATEDRLVGGLDLEKSIRTGRPHLNPGLLAQAHRGFLYVDEINLLEPWLAHLMLDAVESGRLVVEREGLSLTLPARAALIGTMNPEEGPLGPQLRDRFALTVRAVGEKEPEVRREIVRRRLAYEADPEAFRARWADKSHELRETIVRARRALPQIKAGPGAWSLLASLVGEARVSGHRPDLALARAARALAAWEGLAEVEPRHVLVAAEMVIEPRRKKTPPRPAVIRPAQVIVPGGPTQGEAYFIEPKDGERPPARTGVPAEDPAQNKLFVPHDLFEIVTPVDRREQGPRARSGRRTARRSNQARGRYYRSSPERLGRPVALDATFRAAAPHQVSRGRDRNNGLAVKTVDIREKVFRRKTGRLVLFVVDASGSVGSLERMSEAKAAALSLLGEAYRKRDRVALIAFHGREAKVLLPPTSSVEMAGSLLRDLPSGGKTPLAAALVGTERLCRMETAKDPALTPLIVIMTDGRPNVPLDASQDPWREVLSLAGLLARDHRLKFVLVDTDRGHYSDYKLTRDLADALNAPLLKLEDLRQGELAAWLDKVA